MGVDVFQELVDATRALEDAYENQLENDLSLVDIRDRVVSDCLRDQLELQLTWEEMLKTAEFIVSDLEIECDKIFSAAFKDLNSDSYKKLSLQEAKLYAQSDPDYVNTRKAKNKADALRSKIAVIVDAIKTRKFVLKNICDVLKDGNYSHII